MHTSRPSFARYLYARLGPGSRGQCLGHMFSRAFGASDFTSFWRYWNPFVGYFLAYFCFAPLRRFAPRPLCLIVTFALNGFLHDVVYLWPFGFARTESPAVSVSRLYFDSGHDCRYHSGSRTPSIHACPPVLAHARRLPPARVCWPVRLFSRHPPPHTNMTANKTLQATRDGRFRRRRGYQRRQQERPSEQPPRFPFSESPVAAHHRLRRTAFFSNSLQFKLSFGLHFHSPNSAVVIFSGAKKICAWRFHSFFSAAARRRACRSSARNIRRSFWPIPKTAARGPRFTSPRKKSSWSWTRRRNSACNACAKTSTGSTR